MTSFKEIYEEWLLPLINDYKIDKLYIDNKDVLYEYLRSFVCKGITEFECVKDLSYTIVETTDTATSTTTQEYMFNSDLDNDEKKIIAEIAFAKYWQRQIMDVRARMSLVNQREFKKEALAPLMKQNDAQYDRLVAEYMADIRNYNMKHIGELPFWSDFA